jgi:hypothetical protein
MRLELHNVATTSLPRTIQFRASYATISRAGGFSDVDFVVLASNLDQDLSVHVDDDEGFAPSHAGGHSHDLITSSDSRCCSPS